MTASCLNPAEPETALRCAARAATRILGHTADADGGAGDVLLQWWQRRQSGADPLSLAWLWRVTLRAAIRHQRMGGLARCSRSNATAATRAPWSWPPRSRACVR